jgi:DNA-binding CsgD family transcriptional regulator
VLGLVSASLSNKEIARKLGLQPATLKNYMLRILNKLNAKDRRELRWRLES